ncbi:MAG: hypothetical protein H6Q59_583, partial [Firmicutes bacterium]|nr:hypothetical protein [Bacillota bacterium]
LRITASDLEHGLNFRSKAIGLNPFSPEGAPVSLSVQGSKIDWDQRNGTATPVPSRKWISEEIEDIKLIPYGCTNLRMTEMPII